jgi:5-methylcytosine-specific restriction endonuclease McrA
MPRRTRPLSRKSNPHYSMNKLYRRDKGVCYLCEKPVRREEASKDHVVPKSKGGLNTKNNLALTHNYCNWRKGNDRAWVKN